MENTITKKDLADKLTELGMKKKEAQEAVNMIFGQMAETLAAKGCVDIAGFGKFTVVERAERSGFNPVTKEKITIPASSAVKFKPGKALKDSVK